MRIQPLGRPVVPEVKAISATSSAAVATASNGPVRRRASRRRSSGPSPPYTVIRSPKTPARARSATERASHSAYRTRASRQIVASSGGRCAARTVTATAPAFITAGQQAASHGVVGPRSSTRLPGRTPRSSVRARAIASTRSRSCPYVHTGPFASRIAGRSGPSRPIVASSSSVPPFSRSG